MCAMSSLNMIPPSSGLGPAVWYVRGQPPTSSLERRLYKNPSSPQQRFRLGNLSFWWIASGATATLVTGRLVSIRARSSRTPPCHWTSDSLCWLSSLPSYGVPLCIIWLTSAGINMIHITHRHRRGLSGQRLPLSTSPPRIQHDAGSGSGLENLDLYHPRVAHTSD